SRSTRRRWLRTWPPPSPADRARANRAFSEFQRPCRARRYGAIARCRAITAAHRRPCAGSCGRRKAWGCTAVGYRWYELVRLERNLLLPHFECQVRRLGFRNVQVEEIFFARSKPIAPHFTARTNLLSQHDIEERVNKVADMRRSTNFPQPSQYHL